MPVPMRVAESIKKQAIDLHSRQVGEFADAYREMESEAFKTCFNYSRKRLDELLVRFLPEAGHGQRLLDVGCGTGHYMRRYAARGFEVAGCDGSAEMLARAREDLPLAELRQCDVDELPFADQSFDVALSIEVLRYVPDIRKGLREMFRVLRPGGLCLATAAPLLNLNGYAAINRLAVAVPIGNLHRLKQFFRTSWGLESDFRSAGFAPVEVHGVYLGPINWIERLAPAALPGVLRAWANIDAGLADRAGVKELSNMFLIYARRPR
jgi:ubiquinone/menaquinone biosynthesis C-methylase UbiE